MDNLIMDEEMQKVTFIDLGKAVILPISINKMQNPFIKNWYRNGYNEHIAPEINTNEGEVSFASDIWLLGYRIFQEISFEHLNLKPLISNMMNIDASNRINLQDVLHTLNRLENDLYAHPKLGFS